MDEPVIDGIGPDAPIELDKNGFGRSHLPYRFDLIDAEALFKMANILHGGAEKYGVNNWRGMATEDHLNHALSHMYAFLAGDTQDDHLEHAFCRIMFAVATEQPSNAALIPRLDGDDSDPPVDD